MVDLANLRSQWDAIDKVEGDLDRRKWAVASALFKANREDGLSQKAIGDQVGRHEKTVGRWVRVWDRFGEQSPGALSFTEALVEVKGSGRADIRKSETKKELTEASTEEVEATVMSLPPEAQKRVAKAVNGALIKPQKKAKKKTRRKLKKIVMSNEPPEVENERDVTARFIHGALYKMSKAAVRGRALAEGMSGESIADEDIWLSESEKDKLTSLIAGVREALDVIEDLVGKVTILPDVDVNQFEDITVEDIIGDDDV